MLTMTELIAVLGLIATFFGLGFSLGFSLGSSTGTKK